MFSVSILNCREVGVVFSRLLLAAACSKLYIIGKKKEDKLIVQTNTSEVVLCFQIDDKERQIAHILDLQDGQKICDGLIFYAKGGERERVIGLAEMKSTNSREAVEQLKSTKIHIEDVLRRECGSHCHKLLSLVKWKACIYSYGVSDSDKKEQMKDLQRGGFDDVCYFDRVKYDAGPFLRGDLSGKKLADKLKGKRR